MDILHTCTLYRCFYFRSMINKSTLTCCPVLTTEMKKKHTPALYIYHTVGLTHKHIKAQRVIELGAHIHSHAEEKC